MSEFVEEDILSEDFDASVLYDIQLAAGAEMADVDGVMMPVAYPDGTAAEYQQIRESVGLCDVSHLSLFRIAGKGAQVALDRVMMGKVSAMKVGSCAYNLVLNQNGGVVDKLLIYYMDKDDFLLSGCNLVREQLLEHLKKLLPVAAKITDLSDDLAKLEVAGPLCDQLLQRAGIKGKELPEPNKWNLVEINDVRLVISRIAIGGEMGFLLFFDADFAEEIWQDLLEDESVKPTGIGCRELLRIESGVAEFGCELESDWPGNESGIVDFESLASDSRAFIGRHHLHAAEYSIAGVVFEGESLPEAGSVLLNADNEMVGCVTSVAYSFALEQAIGLGRVKCQSISSEEQLSVAGENGLIYGKITPLPLVSGASANKKVKLI